MWKKFLKWISGLSATPFVANINEPLANAADDDIKAHHEKVKVEQDKYTQVMADYLKTFFSRTYSCDLDSQIAFDRINREWKLLVRSVNSTNRLVQLKKDEFERQVKIELDKRVAKMQKQK